MAQRKNPELDAKHQAILRKMMQIPENKTCADCKGPSPRWASTNLGIFLCISCSGIHRKLGTHISQVRSVTLDTWTPAQIAHFTKFGNARAAQYFEACIPPNFKRPPHGDSMQMERFIRDKYENKRYITVENGGLGGASPESPYRASGGSSYVGAMGSLGPRPSQVSGTLSYDSGGYDSSSTTRRTGMSYNSYGGRFGSGSLTSSGGTSALSQTRRTGGSMGQSMSASGNRPGNAMQRASTMKELINMGFSAQHAARAVEATKGDLQKAVDWVLEHNDDTSRGNISSFAPPRHQAPQKDLMDFDDPAPNPQDNGGSKAPQQTRPKAMGTELLMSTPSKTTESTQSTDEADFADFGAFESALPATSKQASEAGPVAANGSLSSTIRDIYKKSPPQRAQPYLNGIPQIARLDQPKQTASPESHPVRTVVSPKLMAQKAAEARKKIPDTDLGLASFMGLATSQYKLSSTTTNAQLSHYPVSHGTASVKPNGDEAPPPPPSPKVGAPMSKTTQHLSSPIPPPPDSPPPWEGVPAKQTSVSTPELKPMSNSSQGNQNPEEDEKTATSSTEQPPSQGEAEEEDPFAALSIMAMKSAKSKGKDKPALVSLQNGVGGASSFSEQMGEGDKQNAPTAKMNNGIDLDELLG